MNNYYDDEDDQRAPIQQPQGLNREPVESWFVLEEEDNEPSIINSAETKSIVKRVVPILVSLVIFGVLVYGGITLWNMFMGIWGEI